MKKVLSILLAVTMILAMIPTTFAAVNVETGAITYNFQIDYDYETETDARNGSGGYLEYRNNTKKYTSYFAENEDGYGRNWAWLGATVGSQKTNSVATAASVAKDSTDVTEYGKGYILSNTSKSTDDFMAVKINIPTPGIYNVSDMNVYNYTTQGSDSLEIYVLPASLSLGGTVAGEVFASDNTDTWGLLAYVSSESAYVRSGQKVFSALNIPADRYVGTYSVSGKSQTFTKADVSGFSQIIADTAGDYIVVIHNADSNSETTGKRLILADFTLTPARLDKTHEYVFNNTVLTGDILENDAFTENYRMFYKPEGEESYSGNYLDSYDNLNSSLTDLWAVSLFGGIFNSTSYKFTSSLGETRLQMIGRKRLNNGANTDANFVLKLNVKYDGIYAITAEVGEFNYGTQADIYMFPADETITDINSEMLKNYNSIGRVSNVTGEGDGDVGTIQLTKGDWYLVFAFNSTNKSTATNSRQYFNLQSITLTETDALPESGTTPDTTENIAPLSFSATTNIPSIAAVTINGNEGNLAVINPSRGAELSVSAPEVSGYKFIGWKAGVANDTGDGELQNTAKFVNGLEQEDTFTVYTSTFLTAVYEEIAPLEDADAVVEFWNLDGSYLGQKSVTELEELAAEDKTLKTSLIGHTFTGWFTAEDVALDISTISEKVTHAVAGYTADATLAATNDDGVRVNGETDAEANAYGKEVICVDNKGTVTHWLRDGKVVSYDETYKYYVWDSTNITSSYAPVEKKPLVVLDGETVSDAYMIEYDGAGKNIVEVGILFGSGAAPTVESKSEIFKSQRGNNHGQFAAKPSDSSYTARGYMIYEENGTYKVIYSE
ncbi:MAG: hypothetical protein E7473_02370 [Ruminococcaceae bacterium]|nr:hypothetical protein [Oscillospiraceae bacterium]